MACLLGNTSGVYIKNLCYLIILKHLPYAILFFITMSYQLANVLSNLTLKLTKSYFSVSNKALK